MRTPTQALAAITLLAFKRTAIGIGACQRNAHEIYDIPSDNTPTAAAAWAKAKYRHPMTIEPPRGAFIYWTGGSTGAGHVAIYDGRGRIFRKRRYIWSPGAPADARGAWDSTLNWRWCRVRLHSISPSQDWKTPHHLVGWAEDICGVRVPGLAP